MRICSLFCFCPTLFHMVFVCVTNTSTSSSQRIPRRYSQESWTPYSSLNAWSSSSKHVLCRLALHLTVTDRSTCITSHTLLRDTVACWTLVDSSSSYTDRPRRITDGDEEIDFICLRMSYKSIAYFTEVLLFDAVSDLQQVLANVEWNLLCVIRRWIICAFCTKFEESLQGIGDLLTELCRCPSLLRFFLFQWPSGQIVCPFL